MRKLFLAASLVFVIFAVLPADTQEEQPNLEGLTLAEVTSGLTRPLYLTHASDGSDHLFVVLQGGQIVILQEGEILPEPFLDLSGLVSPEALGGGYTERGLLGLAFHPGYAENGRFFVNYTDVNGDSIIAEYAVSSDDSNRANPDSARELLRVSQPFANHNGGHMAFGPDGYLYIALGDGGSAGDPDGNGQNPHTLLGTLLRIDVDGDTPYAIPPDNPFAGGEEGAPEVWAWGLRNAWRFSFDRKTGDLYIGDVGQNAWEEIDFQPADSPGGENYGWRVYEGTHRYTDETPAGEAIMPILEYPHQEGCSVTGGYVYRGEALPALEGVYIYGDWCNGQIWAAYLGEEGTWQAQPFRTTGYPISSFGEDEAGEIYIIDYARGTIYRLESEL